jgi:hypothetical protein
MEAEGMRYRAVGADPTELRLRHVDRGARVEIEYQSKVDGVVSSSDGERWSLPAADEGELTVDLPPGVDRLTFVGMGGDVRITRLKLTAGSR